MRSFSPSGSSPRPWVASAIWRGPCRSGGCIAKGRATVYTPLWQPTIRGRCSTPSRKPTQSPSASCTRGPARNSRGTARRVTSTLIRNLAQLATPVGNEPRRGKAMRELRVIIRAAIVMRDGRFEFAGAERELPSGLRVDEEVDGAGATALPGLVDAHTHIVFAGTREAEFNRRLSGETYTQIAENGGGIASTVRSTRAATEAELG